MKRECGLNEETKIIAAVRGSETDGRGEQVQFTERLKADSRGVTEAKPVLTRKRGMESKHQHLRGIRKGGGGNRNTQNNKIECIKIILGILFHTQPLFFFIFYLIFKSISSILIIQIFIFILTLLSHPPLNHLPLYLFFLAYFF